MQQAIIPLLYTIVTILSRYSTTIDTTTYSIIILQSIHKPPANVRHAPVAAAGRPPTDVLYQERPGGRPAKPP